MYPPITFLISIRAWEQGGTFSGDGSADAVRIPIVALTADVMQGARERCLAAGMDDFLPKPVRREDLAEAVSKWVRPVKRREPDNA